jgi:hypothetical protein
MSEIRFSRGGREDKIELSEEEKAGAEAAMDEVLTKRHKWPEHGQKIDTARIGGMLLDEYGFTGLGVSFDEMRSPQDSVKEDEVDEQRAA